MASDIGEDILKCLAHRDSIDTLTLAKQLNLDHQKVIGSVKSLQSLGDVVTVLQQSHNSWELTEEGKTVAANGSHEALVYNAIPPEGIEQVQVMTHVPNAKVGFSKAMSHGWIMVDKSSGKPLVKRKVNHISDQVQAHLKAIEQGTDSALDVSLKKEYKKRNLVQEVVIKSLVLSKGPEFSLTIEKQETDLTADLLQSGAWKDKKFKDYNLNALGAAPSAGYLHPLMKMRAEIRKIFIEMGFQEMPTNNYVESSFWNFDALFQPQQHPARDEQDTFFISHPRTCTNFPQEYLAKVKKVHSEGGYGSEGYKYDWKIEEASKNVLRTHTTAVSARMLYKLAQEKEFRPVKYFSIDRVFRNETLDTTHLAEFFQVEGVIADHNLSLGDLIGVLHTFYKKLGLEKLNFKPTYNPYTEPSMEIFSYHPGLKKWIELGNSGMFRPEMLLPMGLPSDVNVLGFGVSLERPTMIKYGINNIRDLAGPKVNLQMVQQSPFCRLDK